MVGRVYIKQFKNSVQVRTDSLLGMGLVGPFFVWIQIIHRCLIKAVGSFSNQE